MARPYDWVIGGFEKNRVGSNEVKAEDHGLKNCPQKTPPSGFDSEGGLMVQAWEPGQQNNPPLARVGPSPS